MSTPPAGFELLQGAEHSTRVTRIFDVQRDGRVSVCKRLSKRALGEEWMRERLAAEGRLLEALAGRGAPRLVASGADTEGPWIVMDRVQWAALGARGSDPRWVHDAAMSAFRELARVHEADDERGALGVVHGDLSPANVLVSDSGQQAVIVDFGLARWRDAPPMPRGPFRGTLLYAAPEVARGEAFDARADLFALAASLLRVLSGEPPRVGASEAAMLATAGEEPIEPWARRAALGLNPRLGDALVACCAFEPDKRPRSARAIAANLSR